VAGCKDSLPDLSSWTDGVNLPGLNQDAFNVLQIDVAAIGFGERV